MASALNVGKQAYSLLANFGSSLLRELSEPNPSETASLSDSLKLALESINPNTSRESYSKFYSWFQALSKDDVAELKGDIKTKPDLYSLFQNKLNDLRIHFRDLIIPTKHKFETLRAPEAERILAIKDSEIPTISIEYSAFQHQLSQITTTLSQLSDLSSPITLDASNDFNAMFIEFKNINLFRFVAALAHNFKNDDIFPIKLSCETFFYFSHIGISDFSALCESLHHLFKITPKNSEKHDLSHTGIMLDFIDDVGLNTFEGLVRHKIYNKEQLTKYLIKFLKTNPELPHFNVEDINPDTSVDLVSYVTNNLKSFLNNN